MDLCLLCLERNKDVLDIIEINSIQWKILDITNKLEKHFWPLDTLQPKSWICTECIQKLNDFDNFYIKIEEAHMNFKQIINETETELALENTEDLIETEEDLEEFNSSIGTEIVLIENTQNKKEQTELLDTTEEIIEIDEEELVEEFVQDDYMEDDTVNEETLVSNSDNIESRNVNIEETTPLNETQVQNNNVIEFSSENNDSSSTDNDDNVEEHSKPKGKKRNGMKRKCTLLEMDEFIAKEYGQIKCDICEVPLKTFGETFGHYRDVHNSKNYVLCCGKKFYTPAYLVDHLHLHSNPEYFKCKECGKILNTRNNFKIHMKRMHRPDNVEYEHKCEDCGKTFPANFMLRTHKLSHIGVEGQFPCKECGKIYRARHLLKRHFDVTHLKRSAKICAVCGKSCDTSNELRTHMTRHEPQTPVNCDVCGIRLTNQRNYLIHRRVQHPEGGKKDHPCNICNKISPTHRALMNHINIIHKKGYDHKCSVCGKAFKISARLREHMAIHTGDALYKCEHCPKTFNSHANFNKHRKAAHPKEYAEYKHKKLYGTDYIPKQN